MRQKKIIIVIFISNLTTFSLFYPSKLINYSLINFIREKKSFHKQCDHHLTTLSGSEATGNNLFKKKQQVLANLWQ
jgi:hypothetical protein